MRRGIVAAVLLGAAWLGGAFTVAEAAPKPAPKDTKVISIATRAGQTVNQKMNLALDKAAIIELNADARDVLVSNPEIVDAVVRSPRRIFLLAMKAGQTNAFFFDSAGRQILSLDIHVERDTADLQSLLHTEMPDASIRLSSVNGSVLLSGTVTSAADATRAADLAGRYAGGADKVVNMLKIAANEQVMLKVRVAEMQRAVAKQFGVDLAAAAISNGVPIAVSTSNPFGLLGRALNDLSGGQVGQVCSSGANPLAGGVCTIHPNNVQGSFKAFEDIGLIHTLAEPNLTAVSGETAKFLAGGEFPVPASRDRDGNVTVTFKQFGVGLAFTPVVLSENRISLQISTEVSELTNTGAFTLGGGTTTDSNGNTVTTSGLTIPALNVRRAETTVELPSGGSFAIAGLLQHTTKQEIDRFPGLGQMPVLGALFRSRDFQNNETELVVLVSAYLVNPTSREKLALPTDGFVPPTDLETILLGKLNTVYHKTPEQIRQASNGPVGYIVQ
ncbi:MAG TPA: type II and III secretion system protein family protein [Rhizomicrobium sp.]|jgi:pilus assembly protein CpaC|nr:type II and III secretion system protein family protein [Rhizomicrobium sp.]